LGCYAQLSVLFIRRKHRQNDPTLLLACIPNAAYKNVAMQKIKNINMLLYTYRINILAIL